MRDTFRREIDYLRISLTDRCNYRCVYCMPPEGVAKRSHSDMLTLEETEEIARSAVSLGVRKLRVTGGEPLVRRGAADLCRRLGEIPGVEDLSLTTNGALLAPLAAELKAAGVHRVNVSLDTLNPEKFRAITRGGTLADCLAGIHAALDCGMAPVKLNVVLIGGFNDDEIPALAALSSRWGVEVRFIELMPIGHTVPFGPEAYLPVDAVLKRLEGWTAEGTEGVARMFRLPDGGRIGLISPLSCRFCAQCNRLRLTADGFLKPCLHSREEISVRGLHGEALQAAILAAAAAKPADHGPLSGQCRSCSQRDMHRIGG